MHFSPIELPRSWDKIHHCRVPKTLTFIIRPIAKPFIWKWVLFKWKNKIIFFWYQKISRWNSFWKRGYPWTHNELLVSGKNLFFRFFFLSQMKKLFTTVIWLKKTFLCKHQSSKELIFGTINHINFQNFLTKWFKSSLCEARNIRNSQ